MDHYQLDFAAAEDELAAHETASTLTPEEFFHREWVRSMFTIAVEAFRQRCIESGRLVHFQIFERYDLNDDNVSYASLANEFGLDVSTVNNYLAAARRDFRRIVLEKMRDVK
jgi:DNA-directed RNA polymerase specialized sigma24 family protein